MAGRTLRRPPACDSREVLAHLNDEEGFPEIVIAGVDIGVRVWDGRRQCRSRRQVHGTVNDGGSVFVLLLQGVSLAVSGDPRAGGPWGGLHFRGR